MGSKVDDVGQPLLENANTKSGNHMECSSELERILSNTEKTVFHRLRLATWIELKLLFYLSAPVIAVYSINFLMISSTQIIAGHLGNLELAAASLGTTGVEIFVHGLMVRFITYFCDSSVLYYRNF